MMIGGMAYAGGLGRSLMYQRGQWPSWGCRCFWLARGRGRPRRRGRWRRRMRSGVVSSGRKMGLGWVGQTSAPTCLIAVSRGVSSAATSERAFSRRDKRASRSAERSGWFPREAMSSRRLGTTLMSRGADAMSICTLSLVSVDFEVTMMAALGGEDGLGWSSGVRRGTWKQQPRGSTTNNPAFYSQLSSLPWLSWCPELPPPTMLSDCLCRNWRDGLTQVMALRGHHVCPNRATPFNALGLARIMSGRSSQPVRFSYANHICAGTKDLGFKALQCELLQWLPFHTF
jgi:hypothetical protein